MRLEPERRIVHLLREEQHALGEGPGCAILAPHQVEAPETIERREERTGLAHPVAQLARPPVRALYLRCGVSARSHMGHSQRYLELGLVPRALRRVGEIRKQLETGGVLRRGDTVRLVAQRERPRLRMVLDRLCDVAGARKVRGELRRDRLGVVAIGGRLSRRDSRMPRGRTGRQYLLVDGLPVE